MLVVVLAGVVTLSSCNKNNLDIQQNYPFEVKVMPVPTSIVLGKTIEIRITIIPGGNFSDAAYYLRYFQFEGQGDLRYYGKAPYRPNDLYPLPEKEFRLYYISYSNQSQSFDVWISDNFGNEKQLSFEFNAGE